MNCPPLISCVRCGHLAAAGEARQWLRADEIKGYGVCPACMKAVHRFDVGAVVEPGIEPMVDAINAIPGAQAIYSCEGHITLSGAGRTPHPFVIFLASQEVARSINREVFQSWANPQARIYWDMEARFHYEVDHLQWHLHGTALCGRWRALTGRHRVRREIDDEIAAFAARIRGLAEGNSEAPF